MLTLLARRTTLPQETPERSSTKTWDFLFQFTRWYRYLQTLLYMCTRIITVIVISPTSNSDCSNTSKRRIEVLHHSSKPPPSRLQESPPFVLEERLVSAPLKHQHGKPRPPSPHPPLPTPRHKQTPRHPRQAEKAGPSMYPALMAPQSKSVSRVEYSVVRARNEGSGNGLLDGCRSSCVRFVR